MSYIKIASVIKAWATGHEIRLMKEEREPQRMYFYVSSQAGETFQFVIEPERDGAVRMDAHLIESSSGEEVHFVWEVPTLQLHNALDLCLGSAQAWFRRSISI